jgi:hypothetical protein
MENIKKIEHAIRHKLKVKIINTDTPPGQFTLFQPHALGVLATQPGDHVFGMVEYTYTEGEKNYY